MTDESAENWGLVLSGASALTSGLAITLGLLGAPPGLEYLPVAPAAVDFAQRAWFRRRRRKLTKLRTVVERVEEQHREGTESLDDDQIDLFVEVLRSALEDDEASKDALYSAVLIWVIDDQPSSTDVRILADAVRQRSFEELAKFVKICRGDRVEVDGVFWRRMVTACLTIDGSRHNGSPTRVGDMLVAIWPEEAELPVNK